MCGRTASAAMDWLEENRNQDGFVLWVDMWDPHEPFDAPPYDEARYADPAYAGDRLIVPRYGRPDYMSEAERDHVRALYAAQVALVDRWVGRLVEKIDTLGLDRNTMVVYLSDHGHLFHEHGLQGKPTGPLGSLYEVTTRVPLMIRHPAGLGAGRRVPASPSTRTSCRRSSTSSASRSPRPSTAARCCRCCRASRSGCATTPSRAATRARPGARSRAPGRRRPRRSTAGPGSSASASRSRSRPRSGR